MICCPLVAAFSTQIFQNGLRQEYTRFYAKEHYSELGYSPFQASKIQVFTRIYTKAHHSEIGYIP